MFTRRILIPIDLSARSRPALDYGFAIAQLLGASVEVLHVIDAPSQLRTAVDAALGRPLPKPSALELLDARDRLRDAIERCDRRGIVPSCHVEAGDAAATIVRLAAELPADLIVIGTRGHQGAGELLLGSVAHRVIATANCPVLTLGRPALRAAGGDDTWPEIGRGEGA